MEPGGIPDAGLGIAQFVREYPVKEVGDGVVELHIGCLKRPRPLALGAEEHLSEVRLLRLAQQKASVVALQLLGVDIVDEEPVEGVAFPIDSSFLVL